MPVPDVFTPLCGKCYFLDFSNSTYVAWDLEPFARESGYDGSPFRWDEEQRSCYAASWMRPIFTSTVSNVAIWTISWERSRL